MFYIKQPNFKTQFSTALLKFVILLMFISSNIISSIVIQAQSNSQENVSVSVGPGSQIVLPGEGSEIVISNPTSNEIEFSIDPIALSLAENSRTPKLQNTQPEDISEYLSVENQIVSVPAGSDVIVNFTKLKNPDSGLLGIRVAQRTAENNSEIGFNQAWILTIGDVDLRVPRVGQLSVNSNISNSLFFGSILVSDKFDLSVQIENSSQNSFVNLSGLVSVSSDEILLSQTPLSPQFSESIAPNTTITIQPSVAFNGSDGIDTLIPKQLTINTIINTIYPKEINLNNDFQTTAEDTFTIVYIPPLSIALALIVLIFLVFIVWLSLRISRKS